MTQDKYVVAGTFDQFKAYCKKKHGDGILYKYVTGPDSLRGLSEVSGVFIGTFYDRPDIEEIKSMIQIIKSVKTGFTAQSVASLDPRLKFYPGFLKDELHKEQLFKEMLEPITLPDYITKVVS